jgi:hypothetical protein
MQPTLHPLLADVADARLRYLTELEDFTENQAQWKPAPDAWSAVENTEHLFWAEQGGIFGMWKLLNAYWVGAPGYAGELPHRGLAIEEIVARTWQPKELVPAVAAPRLGGPLGFWKASLMSLQLPLQGLVHELGDLDPETIIHPHPISGPLDVRQRLQFLRFHIDRHRRQVAALRQEAQFPA